MLRCQQRHSVTKDSLVVSNVKNMDSIALDMIEASSLLSENHTGIDVNPLHKVEKRTEQPRVRPPVQNQSPGLSGRL
jgi:hypothetical protein